MGRIMLATSNSTDEEYGGTFVARADEIEPVLVLSIPANTYNTWALALSALETAYDALPSEMKLKAQIIRNDVIIYKCTHISEKCFNYTNMSTTTFANQTFNLDTHQFLSAKITTNITLTDISSGQQDQKLEMYII